MTVNSDNVPDWARRARQPIDRSIRQYFVYWAFDAEGRVLYIGCTRAPASRWKAHAQHNPGLVANTARCKMHGPYVFDVARRIERAAIFKENPLFNLEKDKHHKVGAIQLLNEQAVDAAAQAVLNRYGIEASA